MELKIFRFLGFDEIHPDAKMGSLYYRKSQVDELIERKDKAFEYSQAVILVDIKIIKKYKIKHCLAMANKCLDLCNKAKEMFRWADDENLEHHYNKKIEFFARWHNRWLSYAEKIKKG